MSAAAQEVKINADVLKDILKEVVAEARKPVLTERDQRMIEAAQQERVEGAANEKERQDKLKWQIAFCDHMKAYPWNGQTCAVYVKGCGDPGSGNFFLCQHCQGRIHGSDPIPGFVYDSVRDVFDRELFNRLWRVSQQAGMIG